MSRLTDALEHANSLLPGVASPEDELDPRWQAIIAVAEHIESEPDTVWEFATEWCVHPDADLQAAIATCVVEHLLEFHFDLIFPRAAKLARSNRNFAQVVCMCWRFGLSEEPENAARLERLQTELSSHAG